MWGIEGRGKEAMRNLRDYDMSHSAAGPDTFRYAWIGDQAGMGLTGKMLKVLGCRVSVMLREQ